MNKTTAVTSLFLMIYTSNFAQSFESLRSDINQFIDSNNAIVGYDSIGVNPQDTLSLNNERQFPMQSVFKFHIAIVILSEIDKGNLSLNQQIRIHKSELLPGMYSPLREKYPQGTTLSIKEILEYTVSKSDNVGCDVLLRVLGGPQKVEQYFMQLGFHDISIKINEETMQGNWNLQFQNWITPKTSNLILKEFYENNRKLLSENSHQVLWNMMKNTTTGSKRLRGQLPQGTVVAHKTGWSGANKEGVTAAVNNIGIIFLPNGEHFYISVFVTNSKEDIETNERIIATIAKSIWDHYMNN